MYTVDATHVNISASWLDANTTTARVDYTYIYGYSGSWITVPQNMYDANNTRVNISSDWLNANTTMTRVVYTYVYLYGGSWLTVPDDMFNATVDTQVEINASVLTTNTTMVRVSYYYREQKATINRYRCNRIRVPTATERDIDCLLYTSPSPRD